MYLNQFSLVTSILVYPWTSVLRWTGGSTSQVPLAACRFFWAWFVYDMIAIYVTHCNAYSLKNYKKIMLCLIFVVTIDAIYHFYFVVCTLLSELFKFCSIFLRVKIIGMVVLVDTWKVLDSFVCVFRNLFSQTRTYRHFCACRYCFGLLYRCDLRVRFIRIICITLWRMYERNLFLHFERWSCLLSSASSSVWCFRRGRM